VDREDRRWARRAEAAGFSTLAVLDRLAYPNLEPLACLAAAAAVTERISLMTDVLLAPLHSNTALLAKQASTIDAIAGGGRLTLGVGVGGREDDYRAVGASHPRPRAGPPARAAARASCRSSSAAGRRAFRRAVPFGERLGGGRRRRRRS
jgi:alkanesulfonate monooxygenase SsuD/methylene tetrahydromethanopterin reductase-like flavin-dependent oxidoreductase (luciferase family)